ncbi:hypothetical protein NDI43_06410 [Microcoleus vaginatus GB2-A3]
MNDSRPALKKIIAKPILANNSRLSGARSPPGCGTVSWRALPEQGRVNQF